MRIIRKLLISILSFVLFCTIFLLILLNSGKNLIKRENLSKYVKKSEILNIDANILFNLEKSGVTLKEKIYNMGIECNIPEKIVIDILKSEEINIVLGDFFNKTIYYLVNGGDKPELSDDVVGEMIEISNYSLENHINIMMSEDELKNYVINYCEKMADIIPNRQEMISKLPIYSIKTFLNFNSIYLYLLIFILIFLLGLISMSFYRPLKYFGLCLLFSGVLFVILGSMNNFINDLLILKITNLRMLISPLITIWLTIWFKSGVLISFLGVFLVLLYIIINRIIINNYITK